MTYQQYCNCISENLDLKIDDLGFKSDPRYIEILEHLSIKLGEEYLKLIESKYTLKNIDLFLATITENDKYGKPKKHNFGKNIECSPSNLRYLYHALEILTHINSLELKKLNILEIGGGYGGLSLFIHRLVSLFPNINLQSYTIMDLENPTKLQKKYLTAHRIESVNFYTADQNIQKREYYLISNYCLSEIEPQHFLQYTQNVVPMCIHGFLAWNNAHFIYRFSNSQNVEPEDPLTYPGNKIIKF